jgi:hypothetical protein
MALFSQKLGRDKVKKNTIILTYLPIVVNKPSIPCTTHPLERESVKFSKRGNTNKKSKTCHYEISGLERFRKTLPKQICRKKKDKATKMLFVHL